MSWEATAWASRIKTGSPASKLILLTLANFADDEGYCYPSQKTLADITECGERSIRRYLDQLEDDGLIRRVRRHRSDGSRTSDGVYLNLSLPAKLTSGQNDHRPDGAGPTGQALAGHEQPDEQPDRKEDKARAPKPTFNWDTGRVENLPDTVRQKWADTYQAIDVNVEIARAEAWQMANPKNRKADYVRFLNGWLSRAQDRAPRVAAAGFRRPGPQNNFRGKTYDGTPDDEIPWLGNP